MSLSFFLHVAHLAFSLTGIVVIGYGVCRAFLMFLCTVFSKKKVPCMFQHARLVLCRNIVFGLEFMVASDVVRTMASPDYSNIIFLGGLVIIRTVLSYFLTSALRVEVGLTVGVGIFFSLSLFLYERK